MRVVERFYFCLAGLHFKLVAYYKPLEFIFKITSKPLARIERWILKLQAFKCNVRYRSEKSNIADCLSRLCKLKPGVNFDKPNKYHVQTIIGETVPKTLSILKVITESNTNLEIKSVQRKLQKICGNQKTLVCFILSD